MTAKTFYNRLFAALVVILLILFVQITLLSSTKQPAQPVPEPTAPAPQAPPQHVSTVSLQSIQSMQGTATQANSFEVLGQAQKLNALLSWILYRGGEVALVQGRHFKTAQLGQDLRIQPVQMTALKPGIVEDITQEFATQISALPDNVSRVYMYWPDKVKQQIRAALASRQFAGKASRIGLTYKIVANKLEVWADYAVINGQQLPVNQRVLTI